MRPERFSKLCSFGGGNVRFSSLFLPGRAEIGSSGCMGSSIFSWLGRERGGNPQHPISSFECQFCLISVSFIRLIVLNLTLCRETPVRFGSVMVWGWNGSSGSCFRFRRFLCKKRFSVFQHSLVLVSVPGTRFLRFRFRFRFRGKRFPRRFRFPVPVRFLSHPVFFFARTDSFKQFLCCTLDSPFFSSQMLIKPQLAILCLRLARIARLPATW